ncbi:ribose-phosphate diphosphokinase [Candidatus Woesearchaeota archaeon]|nr:ribose-phosphate diphosphokinase [Candidatus Woesearchaeota archaeon]
MSKLDFLIGVPPSKELARITARKAGIKYCSLDVKKFPDGELLIKFNRDMKRKHVGFFLSLNNPNEKIVELLFAAHTAYEQGARELTLIAPYLPYMREDKAFHKGEVVSARILASILSGSFDRVITIDPHLHRIKDLKEIFEIPATKLSSVPLIASYIKSKIKKPLVIGPDEESFQWAKSVAEEAGCKATIFKKHRFSAKHVSVSGKLDAEISKYTVVIVDDIISTGHTMAESIKSLRKAGVKKVYCICVHGLFIEDSYAKLIRAGAAGVVTTNTIQNPHAKIDVTALIAGALK